MGDQPTDSARYRANYLAEQEGVYLYNGLAQVESDTHLRELYRRLAGVEQRHSELWRDRLVQAGETAPRYTPSWRVRMLLWMARRLGTSAVLSTISSMERKAMSEYDAQPEAVGAGLPADERSHARMFSSLLSVTRGGVAGPLLAQFEGRHRGAGGNQLRAAVLGAAITSFFLFALGAILPVLPFIFINGLLAVFISLVLSVFGLFAIGAGVSLTAGSSLWRTCTRQIVLGLLAAGVTFGLGKLIGGAIG